MRKPAIVLLPVWLGWEVIQFMADESGMVAYEAHIGGLLCGALLGGLVLALRLERRDFLDEDVQRETDREEAKRALAELENLEVISAKRRLKGLLERHAGDLELLRHYYAACRIRAADPDLHDAARRILSLPGSDPQSRRLMQDTAADYAERLGAAQSLPAAARPVLKAIASRYPTSPCGRASSRLLREAGNNRG